MTPQQREYQIDIAVMELEADPSQENWQRLKELIEGRHIEDVEKMEKERGLA